LPVSDLAYSLTLKMKVACRYYPINFLEGLRKTMKNVTQNIWRPSSSWAPPEYNVRAFLLDPFAWFIVGYEMCVFRNDGFVKCVSGQVLRGGEQQIVLNMPKS
jgi:hypothetical protein